MSKDLQSFYYSYTFNPFLIKEEKQNFFQQYPTQSNCLSFFSLVNGNENSFFKFFNSFANTTPVPPRHYLSSRRRKKTSKIRLKLDKSLQKKSKKKSSSVNKISLESSLSYFSSKNKSISQNSSVNRNNKSLSTSEKTKEDKESFINRKRGRRTIFERKKKNILHGADDFDNIERKIQVNYFSFLINLANDTLKSILGRQSRRNFKHINYKAKSNTDFKYTQNLFKSSYSDILELSLSTKYKNFTDDHNKKIIKKVSGISPILKAFFEQNYLLVFRKYYYNDGRNIESINFMGKEIKFGKKTKCFYKFLKKNQKIKEIINSVIHSVYLNKVNYDNGVTFITKKIVSGYSNNSNIKFNVKIEDKENSSNSNNLNNNN